MITKTVLLQVTSFKKESNSFSKFYIDILRIYFM